MQRLPRKAKKKSNHAICRQSVATFFQKELKGIKKSSLHLPANLITGLR
jgi:hypothetical protein